jgi:hypothetical protein
MRAVVQLARHLFLSPSSAHLLSGSFSNSQYVGEGARMVRELFQVRRKTSAENTRLPLIVHSVDRLDRCCVCSLRLLFERGLACSAEPSIAARPDSHPISFLSPFAAADGALKEGMHRLL